MSEGIECPHCGESFDVSEQMKANIEKSVRSAITSQVREEMENTYKQRLNDRLESKDDELKHLQESLEQLKSESKDLKNAKKIVLKTHPDKSKLDKKYFLFFSSAYKILFQLYNFKNRIESKNT